MHVLQEVVETDVGIQELDALVKYESPSLFGLLQGAITKMAQNRPRSDLMNVSQRRSIILKSEKDNTNRKLKMK